MLTGEKMSASKKEYQQAKIMSTGRKKCQNTKKCQQAAPLDNVILKKEYLGKTDTNRMAF